MKTGILITARLGSTRLKEKHLLKVKDKEIMSYLIDRINLEFKKEIQNGKVIVSIVTGNKKQNFKFEEIFKQCHVFFGDDDNIPKRHLQAAEYYKITEIVSVDGDDILCSVKAIRAVYDELKKGKKIIKTEGLPLGLNAWGYTSIFLEENLKKYDFCLLETGWGRIFNESEIYKIIFTSQNRDFLRFTLDYPSDYEFFKEIISQPDVNVIDISDEELIYLALNRKIYRKNKNISKKYWKSFRRNIQKEEVNTNK